MMRYLWFVLLSLQVMLLSMIFVAWWSPLFTRSDGNLPLWLYWQQTFDATLDEGWKGGYYPAAWGSNYWTRYWARLCWLYRNNCYAYQYFDLGVGFDSTEWDIVRSDGTVFHAVGPDGLFSYEYGGRWGTYKFGWKALNYTDATKTPRSTWLPASFSWGPLHRVPVCFTVNPFPLFKSL